jgi:hypothetical protein
MGDAGLREVTCRLLASEATLALAHPILAACELLYIRMTLARPLRGLRTSILATFIKL